MRCLAYLGVLGFFMVVAPLSAQQNSDHRALGIAAFDAGKPEEALQHFQAALAKDSLNYDLYCRAARTAWELERVNNGSAYKLLEQYSRLAIKIDSTKAPAYALLSVAILSALSVGDAQGTLESIATQSVGAARRAMKIDAKQDVAHYVIAIWQTMLGDMYDAASKDPEKASIATMLQHLQQAIAIAPTNLVYRVELGTTYKQAGRLQEARDAYEKVVAAPTTRPLDAYEKKRAKGALSALQPAKQSQ